MKRKLLIGLCILVALVVGWLIMYHGTIQNVFDEMYYGHDDIFPYVLHPATYQRFGLIDIHNMTRYMLDDAILEYADNPLVDKGTTISLIWETKPKILEFQYVAPFGNNEYQIVFDVGYDTRGNILTIHPVRFTKMEDGNPIPIEYHSPPQDDPLTKTDIEQIFRDKFLERLTNRWFEVNGKQSRFGPEDYGEITIENHLLDLIPE